MGFFKKDTVEETVTTDKEFKYGTNHLFITNNGYLMLNNGYTQFRIYLKHIDTVVYYTQDQTSSINGSIALNIVGQGVVLGSVYVTNSGFLKDQLQDWLIARIEEYKDK